MLAASVASEWLNRMTRFLHAHLRMSVFCYHIIIMDREEALAIAKDYGLEMELEAIIDAGLTPDEALRELDLE